MAIATRKTVCSYQFEFGENGYAKDMSKSIVVHTKAKKLRCAEAYLGLGSIYLNGDCVEKDEKKGIQHCEIGAKMGDLQARRQLGYMEARAGWQC